MKGIDRLSYIKKSKTAPNLESSLSFYLEMEEKTQSQSQKYQKAKLHKGNFSLFLGF